MADAAPVKPRTPLPNTETNVETLERLADGALIAGRYRIVSQLGVGGMGVVYKARDEELGIDVALKALRPDLGTDPRWIERFRLELVLAREVTHKNVVRIHDIGESAGQRFLTMSLVEGRSLLDVLEKEGRLPLERALPILRQVAEALQAAHDAGIVHRDLKPGNILLTPDDTAFVADFGVARSLDRDGLTRPGAVVGTLDYLSPEQAAGRPVDGRSDIYALGVVLFEMLTGELPFQGGGNLEVLAQRITARPRDIEQTGVRVPSYVRGLIRRCLERSPERRYPNLHALIGDLDLKRVRSAGRLPRRAWTLLLAAALVTGVGVARSWWSTRAPVAAVPALAPSALAVLPLDEQTGDPTLAWTSNGVAEILATQLAESPQLRVVDPVRVQRTLRDLGLTGTADDVGLRRLSELLETGHLVTGSVRRAGHTLRVDLRLVSFAGTDVATVRALGEETPDPSRLFRLVGELGERLRHELKAEPADAAAAEPQTTSLDAASAYRDGRERLLVGDSVGAAPAFERAVKADPRFAAALLGLSEAYQALGYHEPALAAAERAADAVGSSATRLAFRVRARLALLRGDPSTAERAYGELVRRFPNDTEALLEVASAQAARGANAEAVATLRRVTEKDRGDARAWFLLGKSMILAGDARRAVTDPLVRALALMTQLGNQQGQGDVLNAMGVGHQRLGEYPQAAAKYGEAAEIRRKIGDERGAAVSLKNRASIHLVTGRLAEAEPDLQAAQEVYRKIGDRTGQADVWNDFGTLHEGRGEYSAARRDYQTALRIRRELGDEQQLSQSYENVGYMFFLEGEHDNALVYWRQALDLRQKNGDKNGIVRSTQNVGFLQIAQGRWPEAMRSFLDALERAREIEFREALAVSHGNLALLHQYEGRYSAALQAYGEALKILRSLDDPRGLAEFTIKEAAALIELGQMDQAEARLDAAAGWVGQTGNREQASDLQVAKGEWHMVRGESEAARKAFDQALESARASRSRAAILRARIARGLGLVAVGDAEAAAADLVSALRDAEGLGDVLVRIRAAEALARAELGRNRLREAEASARQALKAAERTGWEAGLFRLQALLARIQETRGDRVGAAAAYRESARRIEHLRERLPADLRPSFDSIPVVSAVASWRAAHPATP